MQSSTYNKLQKEALERIDEYLADKQSQAKGQLLELKTKREAMYGLRQESSDFISTSNIAQTIMKWDSTVLKLKRAAETNLVRWYPADLPLLEG